MNSEHWWQNRILTKSLNCPTNTSLYRRHNTGLLHLHLDPHPHERTEGKYVKGLLLYLFVWILAHAWAVGERNWRWVIKQFMVPAAIINSVN